MEKTDCLFKIKIFNRPSSSLLEKMEDLNNNSSDLKQKINTVEEKLEHYDQFCSENDIKKWVIAFIDDQMIGQVAVLSRKIKYNNKDIVLGGIGKVKVRDSHRRKGVATKMMSEAMKELRIIKCDIAYLCTDTSNAFLIRFYKKYGFIPLNRKIIYFGKSGKKYYEKDGLIAPVKSDYLYNLVIDNNEPFNIGLGNW